MTIKDNYQRVLERINIAAKSAGRDPDCVRLIVVTKTHPVVSIQEVVDAGARDLGENYVQDAVNKIASFTNLRDIKWHMIGHVQTRKASIVCQYFDYLHSLDSANLAERINRFSLERNKKLPVWIEVNLSGEDTKSGWNLSNENSWKGFLPEIEKITALQNIDLLGLMTVPPFAENPEFSRPFYQKLKKLRDYLISSVSVPGFTELSIGMSNDFEVAIQEGSTCVRIGQAILGPRKGNQ